MELFREEVYCLVSWFPIQQKAVLFYLIFFMIRIFLLTKSCFKAVFMSRTLLNCEAIRHGAYPKTRTFSIRDFFQFPKVAKLEM